MTFITCFLQGNAQLISTDKTAFNLATASIYVDDNDFTVVKKSAALLQQDIKAVTGHELPILNNLSAPAKNIIIIGSLNQSSMIKQWERLKIFSAVSVRGKWEAYRLQAIPHPFKGVDNALIICGSDRRGTAYGVLEISKQIGVSPWYWWADVPVKKQAAVYIKPGIVITDSPKVKYRGIFINDEAPCLSNWSKEKFGGFNHDFYAKVFELILRLKGNYLWPAMWGNAFYDDDSLDIKTADEYGVVIGTSHHEPLMRAHDEWRRYGKGLWDYDSNEARLKDFWTKGMQRAWNEKVVSIGMRGDGDKPMSNQTATALLERIVADQRNIITSVTGKPADQTPQLWALYKEVQDYYDKGMRVPDDVTLLLCDDNWGNIRKLPKLNEPLRKGGYGIYYHFDYVGGPRNYKWINTNPIPRVWEQMHLAYSYGVKQIWIVNVGDIKPMEFPISFFLDYAWNPDRIGADDIRHYTEQWAGAQFGNKYAKDIAEIISTYSKYNGRRKPELLDENTYSLNSYNESKRVAAEYNGLLQKAELINRDLPEDYKASYFQLVLHPVKACANLQELYTTVAVNRRAAQHHQPNTNTSADLTRELYANDSLITLEYHRLNNGKWNHMMEQTHIGYTYWQQPLKQKMPAVKYIAKDSIAAPIILIEEASRTAENFIPKNNKGNLFYEQNGYVSIEAAHFTEAINAGGITWKVLPDLGRTGDAVSAFPVTAKELKIGTSSPRLEYEFYTYSKDSCKVLCYFSPTLNFMNSEKGLQYAISVDDEAPQVISTNSEDKNTGTGIWNKWVSENIIIKASLHWLGKPGKHVLKYWFVSPAVVLQKIVIDFGGLKPSYLGPPETKGK